MNRKRGLSHTFAAGERQCSVFSSWRKRSIAVHLSDLLTLSYYGELSAILLLEPKVIDGVNKGEVLLFFLYDVLVLKGLLVLDNRVRVAQIIELLHGLGREMLLTMGYRLEHLYLCGAQRLRIILKHRGVDIQYLLQT